jgi:hypothetical protein
MSEVWIPIPNHPNYEISSLGRVRRGEYIKSLIPDRNGYHRVSLTTNGIEKLYRVARLVCEAFHGPPPTNQHWALHRDDNNTNDQKDNLYWGIAQDNSNDRAKNGNNPNTKLDWNKVREIRRRVAAGEKPFAIQGEYGISNSTIHSIVHNKSWREIAHV